MSKVKFNLRITGDLGFEFWKEIPGRDGAKASTYGRIMSKYGHIMSPGDNGHGYLFVRLKPYKQEYVHRYIAETFLPKWSEDAVEVNHKDENPANNRVENIEWMTSKENANYGSRNKKMGEKHSKPILQYTPDGQFVREWESATLAKKSCGAWNICACCRGKLETSGGYKWKYKEEIK